MTKNDAGVAVVGAGNWGSSLIAALKGAGIPTTLIRRGWRQASLDAQVIWICVPDAAIAEVAAKIAQQISKRGGSLSGQVVVHSSGVLSAEVLNPARQAGAKIAAVHPVMSFPTRRVVAIQRVMFGVEAQDAAARRILYALVRRMGGVPFAVNAETKALYHAAGIFASPLLVSAITAATETAELAGLDARTAARFVQALVEATTANVFARGPAQSFSGPFARGDAETIHLHLRALAAHPILADVYRSLARHAIDSMPVKNRRALERAVHPRKIK